MDFLLQKSLGVKTQSEPGNQSDCELNRLSTGDVNRCLPMACHHGISKGNLSEDLYRVHRLLQRKQESTALRSF